MEDYLVFSSDSTKLDYLVVEHCLLFIVGDKNVAYYAMNSSIKPPVLIIVPLIDLKISTERLSANRFC